MKKFSLLSLIIAISMIGFGCATQNGATGKMDSATAIAKIAELQNRAQSAAEAFKQSHPTSDATYIAVRSKYKDAAAKNHGYLAAVQAGILQRQKNFDTPSYHNIATGRCRKRVCRSCRKEHAGCGEADGVRHRDRRGRRSSHQSWHRDLGSACQGRDGQGKSGRGFTQATGMAELGICGRNIIIGSEKNKKCPAQKNRKPVRARRKLFAQLVSCLS